MPIIRNEKHIVDRYHNGKSIAFCYHGDKLFYQKYKPIAPTWQYREVEYIESTGTQYIDTRYVVNKNMKFKAVSQLSSTTATNSNGITYTVGGTVLYRFQWAVVNSNFWLGCRGDSWNTVNADLEKHTFSVDLKNNTGSIDNITHTFNGSEKDYANLHSFILFAQWISGESKVGSYAYEKMYSFKLYDNNKLVRDFIPVVRITDGVAGMWDMANGTFYKSASSTEFSHGEYLHTWSEDYKRVEYVESSGTQYIDTKVNATSDIKLYAKVSTSSSVELVAFGASDGETRLGILSSKALTPLGNFVFQYGKQNIVTNVVATKNTVMELTLDGNSLYKDDELIYQGTKETFNVGRNLYMFATNSTASNRFGIIKLYKASISSNGTLVRNFIPATREGHAGLFDTVHDIFYVSQTSTELIAGNEVVENVLSQQHS